MKLFKLIFILMVSISLNCHFSRAAAQVVHLDGDRLTLDVQKQPLSAILEKLSDQGIRILIDPRINPKISATFVNRPLGQALNSILRSVDYAFIWKKDDASGSDEPRLWEIRIFYKGQGERIRPLKKSTPSVVATGGGVYHMKETLLVKLAPAMTEAALATLLDKLGATIVDRHVALGIIKLRLPQGADVAAITAAVTGYPGVVAIGPDYAYPLESGNPILIDGSSSPALSTPVFSEGGTRVAGMDSGLLASYEDNPYVQGTYDAVSPGAPVNDLLGHGTQMALIAAGVVNPLGVETDTTATNPVVAVRVIGDSGFNQRIFIIKTSFINKLLHILEPIYC